MKQTLILILLASVLVAGCKEKQETETRPDYLFTQVDGRQLRLSEGVLYGSVIREHKDGWEIQLRSGRYFYVQENPLEYLGISSQPCQPETVTLLVKIDSTTYYDGGTEHHWSYVSPDTVMLPGRWVKVNSWRVYKSFFPDSAYHHSGEFRFSDNLIVPCPDSTYILKDIQVGVGR